MSVMKNSDTNLTQSEKKYHINPEEDFNLSSAVSTRELTGLMYRPPLDWDQYESYGELMVFEPQDICVTKHDAM